MPCLLDATVGCHRPPRRRAPTPSGMAVAKTRFCRVLAAKCVSATIVCLTTCDKLLDRGLSCKIISARGPPGLGPSLGRCVARCRARLGPDLAARLERGGCGSFFVLKHF